MDAKHTPGPWVVEDGTLFGKDDGYTVDLFDLTPYETNERATEDARLIAAAPELLAALEFMYENGDGYDAREKARDAIAKALGK